MILLHLRLGAVIVAGEGHAHALQPVQQRAAIGVAQLGAAVEHLDDAALDPGVVLAVAPAQRAIAVEVGVLPHARAVVHQACHPHAGMARSRFEQIKRVGGRDFAAEMKKMLDAQQPGALERVEIGDPFLEGAVAVLLVAEVADAERVQHRGHAGGGALRVVRDHRLARGPAGAAARMHLAFEVVGMQIDRAGDQRVAVE